MNDNTTSCSLHINIILLVAALAGSLSLLRAAETPPEPLYPGLTPACSCESLTNLSLPNTAIESAVVDASNRMCRVTAIVTHRPAGDRVKVWIGLPLTHWNGRFQGTGGGGFLGGHPNSLREPVRLGFSAGATDTGHEGGSGKFPLRLERGEGWGEVSICVGEIVPAAPRVFAEGEEADGEHQRTLNLTSELATLPKIDSRIN